MKLAAHAWRTFWAYHAWAGVALGLVLHVMFAAGVVTLFLEPLRVWEEPAQHRPAHETLQTSPQVLLDRGLAAIRDQPPAKRLWLGLPQRESGVARFQYAEAGRRGWRAGWLPPGDAGGGLVPEREQAATFLYHLHYFGQPAPPQLEYLAGLLAMAFLLTVVTGVLIHLKDVIRQLAQFRPRARLRVVWSDLHKVLGVLGLPFQILVSYTGALMALGPVLMTALSSPVIGHDPAEVSRVVWNEPAAMVAPGAPAANRSPTHSLDDVLAIARTAVPGFSPISFGLQDHGREHAPVLAYGSIDGDGPLRYATVLVDSTTGVVLHIDAPSTDLASHATRRWLSGLHYVYFGGAAIRILLALLGLAGCATILTGNWIWIARRYPRGTAGRAHLLARLTAGAGAGVFVAIAALFVASRVLPLAAAGRGETEQLIFAVALAACLAWALAARSTADTWWRQLALAGALFASVPLWAARVTSAGLFGGGPRLPTVVAVDAGMLVCGALLLAVAFALRRMRRRASAAGAAEPVAPEVAG